MTKCAVSGIFLCGTKLIRVIAMQSVPQELARSILDAAPDAMIIIDHTGIIRFANRQVAALFGHTHEQLIGRSVEFLMPQRFWERHISHRRDFAQHYRMRPMGIGLELFGVRADGSEFPVEISLSPIVSSGQTLIAAAIRNVTERKRAEAELIAAHRSAERARAAADLERQAADVARESADRANQGKSRFLAAASHDLRQPLQALSLLNGVLRRAIHEPEAARTLEQQEQVISAMSRLLNALLDISKLESGAIKPALSDFAVRGLFEEMRQEFAGLAARKGLHIEIAAAAEVVRSDRGLIEQILENLISNAIKYTSAGTVTLRCTQPSATHVRLEVQDTGLGIPAEELRHIYDEFYQVGVSSNSTREGYGLGLSIVQRLVTLLGATLEVGSEPGTGSVFALVLPAGQASSLRRRRDLRHAPPPPGERLAILLVEDDEAVRNATRLLLKSEGYLVSTAAHVAGAVAEARKMQRLDVILTDFHLQDEETGLEVIAAVRGALGRPVNSVLITGDSALAVRELSLDAALRIASKPIKADELLGIIRALTPQAPRSDELIR